MRRLNGPTIFFAMTLAAGILAGSLVAAGSQEAATWNVSPGGMDWSILIPENGSVLTVGGNGVNYQRVFKAGEKPRFSPSDIEGNLLDGIYKWELRISPRGVEPVDDSGMNNGREKGPNRQVPIRSRMERKQLESSLVRSGAFTVLNGGILDPRQTEPGAQPNGGNPSEVQK